MPKELSVYDAGLLAWDARPIVSVVVAGAFKKGYKVHMWSQVNQAWELIHNQSAPPPGPGSSVAQTEDSDSPAYTPPGNDDGELDYMVTVATGSPDPNFRVEIEVTEGASTFYVMLAKGVSQYENKAPAGTQVCARSRYVNDIDEKGTFGTQNCVTLVDQLV